MDFHKFMSLLHFKQLHFTRADRFEDVFEQKMADLFLRNWPENRKTSYQRISRLHRDVRPRTFISCWTNLDKESYAMWQIYAKNNGVAIESTVSRLERALNNPSIRVRRVQYIDFSQKDALHNLPEFWDEEGGLLRKNFFVCKPKAYEYEREIRAVVLEDEDDYSINVHVDVEELIENIYISPFASHWFIDLVEDLSATRYGLSSKNIYMSDIKINRG